MPMRKHFSSAFAELSNVLNYLLDMRDQMFE